MKFSSFQELHEANQRERYKAYIEAHQAGFDRPCEVCWPNPQAYAAVGHVCNPVERRNQSTSDTPAVGPIVAFRATQAQPMNKTDLTKHLNRGIKIYSGYRWR